MRKFKLSSLFYAFGLAFLTACGAPLFQSKSSPTTAHIVGGIVVGTTDPLYRQVADLSVQKGEDWFSCTGTLIAQDVILTAAHCMQGQSNPTVLATIANRSKRSKAVRLHPNFNPSALHDTLVLRPAFDLALVKLSLPFPTDLTPVSLVGAPTAVGSTLRIAGFGEDERKQMGTLKSATTTVAEYRLATKDVVAKVGRVTTGFGDSGGPAFVCSGASCSLAGVTSRTITVRREDIYTSVFESLAWIKSTMQEWETN